MTLTPSSLLIVIALLTAPLFRHDHAVLVSASSSSLQCRSGWTNEHQTISPSQINDGYCDCPESGADEPNTGACSGSMDGMWTGVPSRYMSPLYFACPQQPSLKLPMSRVNDGICDCCDGADEKQQLEPTNVCPDICDEVLADERVARAKAQVAYALGSNKRLESLSQYEKWHADKTKELQQLKEVQLALVEEDMTSVESDLSQAKVSLAREWLRTTKEILGMQPLRDVVGHSFMSVEDLASFIISLCWLSAEVSPRNVVNNGCVALDRASLDLGILWSSDDNENILPNFDYLDTGTESALVDFAEKIILRYEGKDVAEESRSRNNVKQKNQYFSSGDSGDDPYEDGSEDDDHLAFDDMGEYHDHHDSDYVGEDHDHSDSDDVEEDHNSHDSDEEEGESQVEQTHLTPHELLVKSLLDMVPLDRSMFKEQSQRLLKVSSVLPEDAGDAIGQEDAKESPPEDESSGDGNEADGETVTTTNGNEAEGEKETATDQGAIDPMALQMVKSTLSRYISNISRGESVTRSAARFVASVMERSDSAMADLAIMTMYHSKIASEDVAELVYSTSSTLRQALEGNSGDDGSDGSPEYSCSPPWNLGMCPSPHTVSSQDGDGSTYPPSFILKAAQRRCKQHEENSTIGVCANAVPEEDEIELPSTIPDGYYNYYVPQLRVSGSDDNLALYFSSIESLQDGIPPNLSGLMKRKDEGEEAKQSLTKKITDLEHQTGGDTSNGGSSKYGTDGELYLYLHDTAHKIVSGKYEFEVNIWGKAVQRDIGQTHGGTDLGKWEQMDMGEDGHQRVMKWGGGTKCWNGPARSAEVSVTCGAETKLLTADEPEICRYVFTMESPIGCDEHFSLSI